MQRHRYKRAKRTEAKSVALQIKDQLRLESLPGDDDLERLLGCALVDNRKLLLDLTRVAKALMVGYTVTLTPPCKTRQLRDSPLSAATGKRLLNQSEVEELFDE